MIRLDFRRLIDWCNFIGNTYDRRSSRRRDQWRTSSSASSFFWITKDRCIDDRRLVTAVAVVVAVVVVLVVRRATYHQFVIIDIWNRKSVDFDSRLSSFLFVAGEALYSARWVGQRARAIDAPNDDIGDALLDDCQTQTTLGRGGKWAVEAGPADREWEGRQGRMYGDWEGSRGRMKKTEG